MASIGIRELKNSLSRIVRRVAAGETIAVTDHGRTVAHLTPPPSTRGDDRYSALIAAGIIQPAAEKGDPLANWPRKGQIRAPKGLAADLIREDRGE